MVLLRIYLVIGIVGAACDRSQDGGGGSTSQSPDGNAQGDKDAGSSEPAPANRFEGYVRTGTAGAPSDHSTGCLRTFWFTRPWSNAHRSRNRVLFGW